MKMFSKAQSKMLKQNYYALLNNRVLLYFILFLSIVDLLFFSVVGEYMFVGIFIIIGYLTSFFSKNMMVIFTIAMVATNIIRFGRHASVEGMEDQEPEPNQDKPADGKQADPNNELEKELKNENFKSGDLDEASPYLDSADKKKNKLATTNINSISNEDPEITTAGLDKETQRLIEKQKILIQNMDNLDPLLKKAESFMEKFQSLNNLGAENTK
jgi:hypothetical protein